MTLAFEVTESRAGRKRNPVFFQHVSTEAFTVFRKIGNISVEVKSSLNIVRESESQTLELLREEISSEAECVSALLEDESRFGGEGCQSGIL